MKRILKLSGVLAASVLLGISTVQPTIKLANAFNRNAVSSPAEATWVASGADAYTIDENGVISMDNANPSKNVNFFLTDSYNAYGDYTISTTSKGTLSLPVSGAADAGIVPWYVDSDNYIVIYMAWGDGCDRPSEMRNLQITGLVDGKNPFVKKGAVWSSSQWNDVWANGISTPPGATNNLSVTKKLSSTRDSVVFEYNYNDILTGSIEFRDLYKYFMQESKVGVYAFGDSFTIENFNFVPSPSETSLYELGNGVAVSENQSIKNDNGNLVFDTREATSHVFNKYVETNSYGTNPFEQSLTLNVEESKATSAIYATPFYEDEYSYLNAGIKIENGTTYAGFDGRITTNNKSKLATTTISEFVTIDGVDLTDLLRIRVRKSADTFKLFINDELAHEYVNTHFSSGSSNRKMYGYSLLGVKGTIAINELAEFFDPFSWLETELNGRTWYISANETNSVTYDETTATYNILENAVAPEKPTMAYRNSGRYGNVTVEAKIKSALPAGLIAYLGDIKNYINVYLMEDAIKIISSNNGTVSENNYPFEEAVTVSSTEDNHLKTVIVDKLLSVYVNDVLVLKNKAFSFIDLHNVASIGITSIGVTATYTELKFSGFQPLTPIDKGDFTFFGQRPDSWTYDQEKAIIQNKLIEGVPNGWKATNALYKNEESKDLFMGSAIQVLNRTGNEYKVGIMPYWKDADNHLIVWFSQWEGSGSKINATCRINGRVVGSEWREIDIGVDMMKVNYLEAEIAGDVLKVYVNKSFSPNFTTTFDGFSNRDMELAFTGFQVGNGMEAKFTEFTMVSERRVYGLYEQPIIEEIGSRITEGTVGERIKLPVYTASNTQGDALEAVVTVLDPNNNPVTLDKNGFTPEIAGTYSVKVTCVDSWGTEAEPIEYTISVSEAEPDEEPDDPIVPDEPENPDEPASTNKGCGGSIIASSILLTISAGIGAALLISRKRKK